MNWEAIGAIAEIVGAAAVVVTLAFLAVEVRSNKRALESASIDGFAAGYNAVNSSIMENADLAEIYRVGIENPEDLTETQKVQFIALGQSYINQFTTVKKYRDGGLLSDEEWDFQLTGITRVMNTPGGKWLRQRVAVAPNVEQEFQEAEGAETPVGFWAINKDRLTPALNEACMDRPARSDEGTK